MWSIVPDDTLFRRLWWIQARRLSHIKYYRIETNTPCPYSVSHQNYSKTGEYLAPGQLRNYTVSLKWFIKFVWGYELALFTGLVFAYLKEVLYNLFKNKIREQKRQGQHSIPHDVFSRKELMQLYQSNVLSMCTHNGYQVRLVPIIGMLTGTRLTAFATLSISQIQRDV